MPCARSGRVCTAHRLTTPGEDGSRDVFAMIPTTRLTPIWRSSPPTCGPRTSSSRWTPERGSTPRGSHILLGIFFRCCAEMAEHLSMLIGVGADGLLPLLVKRLGNTNH